MNDKIMHPYILGIIWALGRYINKTEDSCKYYFIRHKKSYFLQVFRQEFGLQANIHTVTHKGKTQYRLKITGIDITQLNSLGWQPRNTLQRCYPLLTNGHRDFVRAYLEIHSNVDTVTIRKRNRNAYKQPRLRIFGNMTFLAGLTAVLESEVGIGIKKPQQSTKLSEVSGTMYYQSTRELQELFEYLYRPPIKHFDRGYYEKFSEVLRQWGASQVGF